MTAETPSSADDLATAFMVLSEFLGAANLTAQLAQAESELVHATANDAGAVAVQHGFTQGLLDATLLVRSKVGRLNDVVHATTIALAFPHILEPGERVVNRPSLGAGNDPAGRSIWKPIGASPNSRWPSGKAATPCASVVSSPTWFTCR